MSQLVIKVAIADDHSIIRDGLKMLFGDNNGISVVAEAATGKDTIKMATRTAIDVLLLDINLPDKSGIEVLEAIRRVNKELPILIFSMCPLKRSCWRPPL